MSNAQWFLLVGCLLLATGLSNNAVKRLPITSAIIYLAVGLLFGPTGLNRFHFNPLEESALLEALTEVAVLISLYAAGVKMPSPWTFRRWRSPILLASVSMTVTVMLVALFATQLLGLSLGVAILLGAIVAPTDPVLATAVQIRHPGDRDRLRFHLTCEAGMNDGSAFPFVMLGLGLLGLHDLGNTGLRWLLVDVLWATAAGIAVGVLLGSIVARMIWAVQKDNRAHGVMHDFIGLGLVGMVYGVSELISAWGFLAVFFAAVSLRQTELKLTDDLPEQPDYAPAREPDDQPPRHSPLLVSEGSLIFKEHLERLSEIVLVLLVGGSLFLNSWSWRAVGLALFVFFAARPLSVVVGLVFSRTPWRIRGMIGWFGVRGIGSLYYLMYAIQHGLPEGEALELIHLTLIVITLSILVHGISVKPLLKNFRQAGTRH